VWQDKVDQESKRPGRTENHQGRQVFFDQAPNGANPPLAGIPNSDGDQRV